MTQNIAVIAANGKSGQLIVREAVDRGLDVTAVVRGENKTVTQHAIIKDLFDLTAADLAGFDVVVDAFGAWTPVYTPSGCKPPLTRVGIPARNCRAAPGSVMWVP